MARAEYENVSDMTEDIDPAYDDLWAGPLGEKMGITIHHAVRGRVEGRMPVESNTQPMGVLHGGATAVLAESLGSWAAYLAAPEGHIPVGTELSVSHLRSSRSGSVIGVATALHEGRRTAVYQIDVRRDSKDQALVSSARLTCMFVPAPPDAWVNQETKTPASA